MNRFVYLDNNATTKVSEDIRMKLQPYLELQYGNPSSIYNHGLRVRKAINGSRINCAKLINCDPQNLIFTSGGSEGNCASINSAISQMRERKKIVTTKVEHSSILEYCKLLEARGYDVTYLNVDSGCNIDVEELVSVIDEQTCLVSIQVANNEVGTLLLRDDVVEKVKALKKQYGFLFHIDAVQGLGKVDINCDRLGADFISFSGHKIHCPKGIGMLYIKDVDKFIPLIAGHQEFGLRGGTENVLGIIAMGESCKNIIQNLHTNTARISDIREYLESELGKIDGITINCVRETRIPNTTSITFDNYDGNKMLFKLENFGVCVSTGSACNSESSEPSYVLTSMGVKNPQSTIRISIDESTTKSQIDYFIDKLQLILKGE